MATSTATEISINKDAVAKSLYTENDASISEEELYRRRETVERSFLVLTRKQILFMSPFIITMVIGFGYYIIEQLSAGLTVTGLSQKVFWGAYITSFVFWIGVSHVGMLISAVLRMLKLKYRTPITRIAEEVTIVSLVMGAASVLIDMGRLDRAHHLLLFGNITSPLIWDVISINFYLFGSLIFFITPLIPDLAYYRDNLHPEKHKLRIYIYKLMSFNFKGTPEQYYYLNNKVMERLKYIILPVALSVHTVVSWIFAVTWRPGWKSTIFGPYFISGAIFSGTAALITALVLFTIAYKLEKFITITHIKQVTIILLLTALAYTYFTFNEYLPGGYQSDGHELDLARLLYYGDQAVIFWSIIILGIIVPIFLSFWVLRTKDQPGNRKKVYTITIISTLLINIGAWFKRWIIIVPTLRLSVIGENEDVGLTGRIVHEIYPYSVTAAEVWITLAQLSFFIFFYWFLNKLIPLIPMWEVEHEWEADGIVSSKTPQRKFEEAYGNHDRSFLYEH